MSNKIVFNTWAGAFFNPGGGEVQLLNTKKHLEKANYKIEIYNQWAPQREIDILHQFSLQPGTEYVVDGYKELGKKIAISTIFWAEFPKDSFYYHQFRNLMGRADVLFTNSDAESTKLARGFDIDIKRFVKTRNSITPAFLTKGRPELFENKYKISGDFVISVANIDRRKNTKALVEACRKLNLRLILIGAVRDLAYFNEFKDSYIGLTFLGPITDVEMIKSACCACRVFALPSLCETPGISALEAASQGARVVITSEGAAKEYLEQHAIYVRPDDQEMICQALIEAMETKPDEKQIKFIRERYTWDQTAREVSEGYHLIMSSKSR